MVKKCFAVLLTVALLQFNEAPRPKRGQGRRATAGQSSSGAGTSGYSHDEPDLPKSIRTVSFEMVTGEVVRSDDGSSTTMMMPKKYIERCAHRIGEFFEISALERHLSTEPVTFTTSEGIQLTLDGFVLAGRSSPEVSIENGDVSLKVKGNFAVCGLLLGRKETPNGPRHAWTASCISPADGVFVYEVLFSTSQSPRPSLSFTPDQLLFNVAPSALYENIQQNQFQNEYAHFLRGTLFNKLMGAIQNAVDGGWADIRSYAKSREDWWKKQDDFVEVKASIGLGILNEPGYGAFDVRPIMENLLSANQPNTGRRGSGSSRRRH